MPQITLEQTDKLLKNLDNQLSLFQNAKTELEHAKYNIFVLLKQAFSAIHESFFSNNIVSRINNLEVSISLETKVMNIISYNMHGIRVSNNKITLDENIKVADLLDKLLNLCIYAKNEGDNLYAVLATHRGFFSLGKTNSIKFIELHKVEYGSMTLPF